LEIIAPLQLNLFIVRTGYCKYIQGSEINAAISTLGFQISIGVDNVYK